MVTSMGKEPSYTKGIIIAHGKCELLLAQHIKSNLHLPINICAENNGKTSIQIESLMKFLKNSQFKNEKEFDKNFAVENSNGRLINFTLMPIMDFDNSSEEDIHNYVSGEMFKNHWLYPYILPIWNNKNLDEVLLELNLIQELPTYRGKGQVYSQAFPTNKGNTDVEQVKVLMELFAKSKKTNMEFFIKKCLDSM